MVKEDVIRMLGLLKTAYPNYYKGITKQEAEDTILLYCDMFRECDSRIVIVAIKELINNLKFPPTIADIKEKMDEIVNVKKTPIEHWNELASALRDGIYHSQERFMELSPEVKAFVKNPSQLKEMAMMDSDVVHSVLKGQFLKQIEIIQARNNEDKKMLPESRELREMLENIGKNVNLLD